MMSVSRVVIRSIVPIKYSIPCLHHRHSSFRNDPNHINRTTNKPCNIISRCFSSSPDSDKKQNLILKYGPIFMVFHMGVSLCSLASLTVLISRYEIKLALLSFIQTFLLLLYNIRTINMFHYTYVINDNEHNCHKNN